MSKLIDELIQDHKEITDIFEELRKANISTPSGFELLMKSRDVFLAHLSKEDNFLYPPLIEKAKTNKFLQKTLDTFGSEMEEITKSTCMFYEKYSKIENVNEADFLKDIISLIMALKNRIMKEEVAIYKSFENLKLD